MPVLYVKDDTGNFISIPALKGDKGDKGDSGDGSGDMLASVYDPAGKQGQIVVEDEVPQIASQSEAETGTNNTKIMTPLRSKQAATKFIHDGAAALTPTISGDSTTRDLTVPAGSNPNRLTILLPSGATASSAIRLCVGTGAYYPLIWPKPGTVVNALSLLANVPHDLIFNGSAWIVQNADTDWQPLTLLNSWANYGAPFSPASVRRIGNVVYLRGMVADGSTTKAVIASLPAVYRPAANMTAIVATSSSGESVAGVAALRIESGGDIWVAAGGSLIWTALDGVAFAVI